jgi:hypothetical protein
LVLPINGYQANKPLAGEQSDICAQLLRLDKSNKAESKIFDFIFRLGFFKNSRKDITEIHNNLHVVS